MSNSDRQPEVQLRALILLHAFMFLVGILKFLKQQLRTDDGPFVKSVTEHARIVDSAVQKAEALSKAARHLRSSGDDPFDHAQDALETVLTRLRTEVRDRLSAASAEGVRRELESERFPAEEFARLIIRDLVDRVAQLERDASDCAAQLRLRDPLASGIRRIADSAARLERDLLNPLNRLAQTTDDLDLQAMAGAGLGIIEELRASVTQFDDMFGASDH